MPPTLWAFDTETYLITDTDKAPKPVVCSWYNGSDPAFLTAPADENTLNIWANPEHHFVGHNIAFDLCVMMRWHPVFIPFIVRAVEEGRVWDTQTRQQLIHLEQKGEYKYPVTISLSDLEKIYLNIDRSEQKKGEDVWRLRYGTLDGVPFEQWPDEAVSYAIEDAVYTWCVFQAQGGPTPYPTESLQIQAALSLSLVSTWGFHTNQQNVAEVKQRIELKMNALREQLDAFQLTVPVKRTRTKNKVKEVYYQEKTMGIIGKGTNPALYHLVLEGWKLHHQKMLQDVAQEHGVGINMDVVELSSDIDLGMWLAQHKAQKWEYLPAFCWNEKGWNPKGFLNECLKRIKPVARNSRGEPKVGENDIEDIVPYVPILKVRAEYKHQEKMLATYVLPYEGKYSIHAFFKPMVGTGRTACASPNLQNVPPGKEGFRKNVWARPGYLLGTVDYSALELVTFAATIVKKYGQSDMAEAINAGMDVHCMTASGLFDKPYEEILANKKKEPYKDWRQGSKALNFGGLGGLGKVSFQSYAKYTYGVDWSLDECGSRIKKWKAKWPETKKYFSDNGQLCDGSDGREATAINNMGRKKANCRYTQLCNYPFQSLAADGVKAAMWELIKHQLLGWFWTDADSNTRESGAKFMYTDPAFNQQMTSYNGSPLRRSHIVNMVHDELVMEHPTELAEEGFALQQKIMVDTMALYTTGVQPSVEGKLDREWDH
ncbi:MAG: hypothetical protein F6K48_02865 [Okeania sp. SIO3H1]|nr:hypothetical protein [Okeania sp. SIO3H1]